MQPEENAEENAVTEEDILQLVGKETNGHWQGASEESIPELIRSYVERIAHAGSALLSQKDAEVDTDKLRNKILDSLVEGKQITEEQRAQVIALMNTPTPPAQFPNLPGISVDQHQSDHAEGAE